MRVERELVAILHYAREDVNVYSVNGNIPKRLRGRQCERLTLTRQLSRAESWVILPMLHPHGRWRLGDGPWQEGQGGIVDETQRQIDVTMHVVARHGRVVVLDTSDPRVGFELDDEDQVLELVEADEASLVVLEGKGAFLDEGLPVLTPVNPHRPLTWRRIRGEGANFVAVQWVLDRIRAAMMPTPAETPNPTEDAIERAKAMGVEVFTPLVSPGRKIELRQGGQPFFCNAEDLPLVLSGMEYQRRADSGSGDHSADTLRDLGYEVTPANPDDGAFGGADVWIRDPKSGSKVACRVHQLRLFAAGVQWHHKKRRPFVAAAMTLTERAKSMLTEALPSIADTLPELMQPAELEAWNTHITVDGTLRIQVGWDEADGAPVWVDFANLVTSSAPTPRLERMLRPGRDPRKYHLPPCADANLVTHPSAGATPDRARDAQEDSMNEPMTMTSDGSGGIRHRVNEALRSLSAETDRDAYRDVYAEEKDAEDLRHIAREAEAGGYDVEELQPRGLGAIVRFRNRV